VPSQAPMLPPLTHMYKRSLSAPCHPLPELDVGAGVHVEPGPAPRYTGTASAHSWWDQERGGGGEASERDPTNTGTRTTTVAHITPRPPPPPFLLSPPHSSIHERRPSLDEPFMAKRQSQSSESQSRMSDTEQRESPNLYSQASSSAVGPLKKKRTRTLVTSHQSAVLHALLAQVRLWRRFSFDSATWHGLIFCLAFPVDPIPHHSGARRDWTLYRTECAESAGGLPSLCHLGDA
jgi:hypothetical protein